MKRLLLLLVGGAVLLLGFSACSGGSQPAVYYTACVVLGTDTVKGRPAMLMACRDVTPEEIRQSP